LHAGLLKDTMTYTEFLLRVNYTAAPGHMTHC